MPPADHGMFGVIGEARPRPLARPLVAKERPERRPQNPFLRDHLPREFVRLSSSDTMPLSTLNTTLADVVWPALYVEQRMFSWWAIGLGILIEFLFVRRLTTLNWRMCVVADVAMNAVSALLGLVLIPIGGLAWEVFPGGLLNHALHMGTFGPLGWGATFVVAVLINAELEALILRFAFRQKNLRQMFWWLCVANALSVGIAYASFAVAPRGSM